MTTIRLQSRIGWFLLALTVANCIGCAKLRRSAAKGVTAQPQLVVLYAPCSVGKRFLSPYDRAVLYTPNLDTFARTATVFAKHRTEAGLSGIAYASILTGNQAPNHGVYSQPTHLADSVYDITQAYADNGYDVYFWNDHPMGDAGLNYGQGVPPEQVFERLLESDDRDFALILKRLRADKQKKAFVFVNYRVNHNPYEWSEIESFQDLYPREFRDLGVSSGREFGRYVKMYLDHQHRMRYDFERFRQQQGLTDFDVDKLTGIVELLYKANLPVIDDLFGRIVERIDGAGLGDNSLIAFTADHGESLFRLHAPFKWSHGHAVQADVIDVPLVIRMPLHLRTPGRCDYVTRSIDVFPTLAALSNLQIPAGTVIEGQDLSKLMRPEAEDPGLSAFSHTGMVFPALAKPLDVQALMGERMAEFYPSADMDYTWVAVRRGDLVVKYRPVKGSEPTFQAFDLASDPGESTNIYSETDALHQQMSQELAEYKTRLVDSSREWASAHEQGQLDEQESLERLRRMRHIK